jgi:hypothetical protein
MFCFFTGYSHLEFREELVRQLGDITDDTPVPIYQQTRPTTSTDFISEHLPIWTDQRHNCSVCYRLEKVERKCHFTCSADICSVLKPSFCLGSARNCFQVWHSAAFNSQRKGKGHW